MLVSIIVPVYNIEENIEVCLQSILNQKYKNIEIIIVNDGSCDNSLNIINKFSDERIKVYTTQNQGLGAARNFGFEKSSGDYVCFVDGDDSVEPHYVENMLKWALKGFDIVVCDYNLVFTNKNGLNPLKKIANKIVSPKRFKGIDQRLVLNYRYIAWNKMYKRSLLEDFAWGVGAHEDISAIALLFKNPQIKYIQDKLYNYFKRSNTLSTSVSEEKIENIKENYNYVLSKTNEFRDCVYLRQYSSLLVNIVTLYQNDEALLQKRLVELNKEFYEHTQDIKLRSKLGIAKKKYVEAGLKTDIKRLLFINKFVSK